MADSTGTILVLVLLTMGSAFFSATETAFSSMNKIRMRAQANEGNRRAALALRIADDYDKLLSTILVGNNIVNIAATALATLLFTSILGNAGASVSTIVMTVTVLIFGEVTPKSIAKDMPERFAMFSAPFLNLLVKILTPINFLFSCWKKLIRKIVNTPEETGVTEAEILTLVDAAESDGSINEQEGDMIRGAIEFNDLEATDVLTPRVDVSAIEDTASVEEVAALFEESGYSRLPVYHEDMDHIVGVIHQKDFYGEVITRGRKISDIIGKILYVAPGTKISKLLHIFQAEHSHMAVVLDEYGGTDGIVTLEDVIEEIVGEIFDEHDEIVKEIEQIDETHWKVLGTARVDDLFETIDVLPDEEFDYQSVNGWASEKLGGIPKKGESFTDNGLLVKIIEADDRRVIEVAIEKLVLDEAAQANEEE